MKRLFKLFLIMIMVVPFIARADMGAPEVSLFEAYVMTDGGADYYKFAYNVDPNTVAGHLDKDAVVSVMYEDYTKEYYVVQVNNSGETYRMKKTDLAQKDEVTPDSPFVNKEEKPFKARVNNVNGLDVYKGPSDSYATTGHVIKGVEFVVNYTAAEGSYVYIDNGEVKGWINGYDGDLLYNKPAYFVFTKNTKLNDVTIPKDTVLLSEWCTDAWGRSALFNYQGEENTLYVFREDGLFLLEDEVKLVKTNKEVKTYSKLEFESQKVSGSIAAGTELYIIGYGNDTPDEIHKIYVVEKGKTEGVWVDLPDEAYTEVGTEKSTKVFSVPEVEVPTVGPATTEDKKDAKTYSTQDVVIISAIVGGVVALTAIVVIVLINKKKNNQVANN